MKAETAEEFLTRKGISTLTLLEVRKGGMLKKMVSLPKIMEEYASQGEKEATEDTIAISGDFPIPGVNRDNISIGSNAVAIHDPEAIHINNNVALGKASTSEDYDFGTPMYETPKSEKEEVESGWVIVNDVEITLWDTFEHTKSLAKESFLYWDDKEEQGYKCVRATRITRLTKTTEG